MTKKISGLLYHRGRKNPLRNFDRLYKWLVAGLVILIATSEFRLAQASAETGSAAGVKVAAKSSASTISEHARATASELFGDRCAVCHGQNGDGNGPGAANLNPKPVDFRDSKWQRSVTDEKITKAIVYGGTAVGLSSLMSANPDLETQPGVVAALVEQIRGLAKKHK